MLARISARELRFGHPIAAFGLPRRRRTAHAISDAPSSPRPISAPSPHQPTNSAAWHDVMPARSASSCDRQPSAPGFAAVVADICRFIRRYWRDLP
jgi:hypothetical protein